jgi:hypothetical protein
MLSEVATMTDVPPDPDWHDDAVLLGELATLNAHIARYVIRMLDADAERGEPVSPADEAALGRALVVFGQRLSERTQRQPFPGVTSATEGAATSRVRARPEIPQSPRFSPEGGPNP